MIKNSLKYILGVILITSGANADLEVHVFDDLNGDGISDSDQLVGQDIVNIGATEESIDAIQPDDSLLVDGGEMGTDEPPPPVEESGGTEPLPEI